MCSVPSGLSGLIGVLEKLRNTRWLEARGKAVIESVDGSSRNFALQLAISLNSNVCTAQGLCAGFIVLVTSRGASSHILSFNEEIFFIYLLPPIIFNAGLVS